MPEARSIQQQPSLGGAACPTDLLRKVVCNDEACPVDCKVTEWNAVQKCSKPCGGGMRKMRRQLIQPAAHGGIACPTSMQKWTSCNEQPCRGIDCIVSDWANEGQCSKTCGSGLQPQFRKVLQTGSNGGLSCKGFLLHRKIPCNPTPCQRQAFDPVAAGQLTGFDFDVAQYCEDPELCGILEAFELGPTTTRPASSSERNCPARLSGWLLLVFVSLQCISGH